MARRPDLERFAMAHSLKIGTIADLIRYRLKNERSWSAYMISRSTRNSAGSALLL